MMVDVVELTTRILCDTMPDEPLDGAYLYCNTADNLASVIQTARKLVDCGKARKILILGAEAMSGYPGVMQCCQRLEESGVEAQKIGGIPLGAAASINTLIESEALVKFAKDRNLCSLIVTSAPFHQLRAFMTAVTVAIRIYPDLLVYSCPGAALPWMDEVVHSQGVLQATRRQLIQEELDRVDKYQNKGDLATFKAVLEYLRHRDMNN